MPNYNDPRIFEIITPVQMQALQDAGYMLVREQEVRDVIIHTEWIDELIDTAVDILDKRHWKHPNSSGIYHLEHRVEIIDGVYVDPDS